MNKLYFVRYSLRVRACQIPEITYNSAPNLLNCQSTFTLAKLPEWRRIPREIFLFIPGRAASLPLRFTLVHAWWFAAFEFDPNGKYVREIGQGVYGFLFAQSVKIDPQDNIWVVDRGSNMLIKFDPAGRVVMTLGGTGIGESLPARAGEAGWLAAVAFRATTLAARPMCLGCSGNIFVSDGLW